MTGKTEAPARLPGRPRDARADRAILDAALESFIEFGYEGMSIESIAARAGVGKTTIYRRWPSKEELVVAAIENLFEDFRAPNTGDVRADLISLVGRARRFVCATKAGEALPRMLGELASGSSLGRAYYEKVMMPRRQAMAKILQEAKERGELRSDLDVDLALAALIGSVMFLRITRTLSEQRGDFAERLVTQLIDGMCV